MIDFTDCFYCGKDFLIEDGDYGRTEHDCKLYLLQKIWDDYGRKGDISTDTLILMERTLHRQED